MNNLKKELSCFHCGEDCVEKIEAFDKIFCCEGCKTVFEILSNQGLEEYYSINNTPGIKRNSKINKNYDFLSHKELLDEILDFSENGKSRITLFIPQIHCSSCIWLLENLSKINFGVLESRVNYSKKEVDLLFNHEVISLKELVLLLISLGYEPVINHKNEHGKNQNKITKELASKIGVAGFCFGNIMLLSFPEYLDHNGDFVNNYGKYFGLVCWFLSLPVLIYSGRDYFLSAWQGAKNGFINIDVPIAVGILALFFKSSFEILTQTGQGYFDSLAGLVFFLLIGKWYQSKSYDALSFEKDFTAYFPLTSIILNKDGSERNVLIDKINKGDVLKIRNQEIIPADGVLESDSAEIDYSFVTGESFPLTKNKGDKLFAGGKLIGSQISIKTVKKVSQSYLTQLWQNKERNSTQLTSILDKISKYFSITILCIALLSALFWLLNDPPKALEAFTSVLIIACPCALALTVPFGLGGGLRLLGKKGIYLKNTGVIEKLNKIDCIVFDKTGTLTENEGYNLAFQGEELGEKDLIAVKSMVANSTHPYSEAIHKSLNVESRTVIEFKEIVGKGITGIVDGKLIKIGSFNFVCSQNGDEANDKSGVFVSIDNNLKGFFNIEKKLRDGLKSMFLELRENFDLHLVSGDTNKDLKLLKNLFENDRIYFNQSPIDKLNYIKNLQGKGKSVLMVGDGLNDAGALKQSEVGIAVSENTQAFSPACDAILIGDKLVLLNQFLRYSKKNLNVIKYSIVLSFLYNVGGLYFASQALISPLFAAILMPLSSVTVVLAVSLGAKLSWTN